MQDATLAEHASRLESLTQTVVSLARRQHALLADRLDAVRQRHVALCTALLGMLRKTDLLEGRFAHAMGHRALTPASTLRALDAQLREVEDVLRGGGAGESERGGGCVGGLLGCRACNPVFACWTAACAGH